MTAMFRNRRDCEDGAACFFLSGRQAADASGRCRRGVSSRKSDWGTLLYNIRLPATRQIGPMPMLGVWGVLCVGMILFATASGYWYSYGGRAFVASFAAFAMLFAGMLLFAARGVLERVAAAGPGAGWLYSVALFLVYVLYATGTGTLSFLRLGEVAVFLFAPLAVLASARGAGAGAWQDLLVVAGVWAAVKFGPSRTIWPYPGGRLSYILTVLLAVNLASLLAFACIAIPLGVKLRFIAFDVQWAHWKTEPALALGILFFTAWPEEFLFRGLLQNCLSRAMNSDLAGWVSASVLFGFSHITN